MSNDLVQKFADSYSMDHALVVTTLKNTAFKQGGDNPITNEQMMALLIVADQYGLNPFTREIYAFPDKNKGIVPVVGVDGWSRIINQHPQYDGMEFNYSEQLIIPDGGKECPVWMECTIYRKDRAKPTTVREYLDEVYRKSNYGGPWQSHTKRFLRHKTVIQCSRLAFGFTGIFDQDEAERIVEKDVTAEGSDSRPVTKMELKPLPDSVYESKKPGWISALKDGSGSITDLGAYLAPKSYHLTVEQVAELTKEGAQA